MLLALILAQALQPASPDGPIYANPAAMSRYAFFEAFPGSGAGTFGVCSTTPPTGAKGEALTFARASTATCTRTGSGGLAIAGIANGDLVTMSAGQPRVEYDSAGTLGLLLESSRINSLLRSQEIDNVIWSKASAVVAVPTVTADFAVAPDGTTTAERVQFAATDASGTQASYVVNGVVAIAANPFGSVFIKGNGTSGTLDVCQQSSGQSCTSCAYVSGSWSRCSPPVCAATTCNLFVGNMSLAVYNGGVARAANDVLVWGAQLEAGAYATSYIPTTSAAVTRVAETASFPLGLSTASDFLVAENLSWSGFNSAGCAGDTIFSATPGPYLNSCFSSIGYGGVIATVGTGANGGSASSPSRIGIEWVRSTSTSRILINGSYFAPSTNVSTASSAFGSFTLGAVGIHSRLCGESSLSRCR